MTEEQRREEADFCWKFLRECRKHESDKIQFSHGVAFALMMLKYPERKSGFIDGDGI